MFTRYIEGTAAAAGFARPKFSHRRAAGRVLMFVGMAICLGVASACRTGPVRPPKSAPIAAPNKPHFAALDASVGRVVTVNLPLRFVVVDFSLSRMPQPGDRLELTRAGIVVGGLKTGFHSRANTLVADILTGTPEVGDEARPVQPEVVPK